MYITTRHTIHYSSRPGDDDGKTPLHCAFYEGHVEMVKALLAAKVKVNKVNKW